MHASLLTFLELTVILVSFMLLHSMKPMLGSGVFYVAMGTSLVMSQMLTAAGMHSAVGMSGMQLEVGTAIFFPPMMAALLITYVLDGTLAAQRLVAGIAVAAGLFFFLSYLSELQCTIRGFELSPFVPGSFISSLLGGARRYMAAALLAILVQFLVLPVTYQAIRLRECGVGSSVFGALMATQVLDTFFYELVTEYPADDWWYGLGGTFAAKAVAMVWVAALTSWYIHHYHHSGTGIDDARRPFDLISDLLSRTGRRRRLQASVREWEGRYRVVVENTNDLIVLADESGTILDANYRALESFGRSLEELGGIGVTDLFDTEDSPGWLDIWNVLYEDGGAAVYNRHDLKLRTATELPIVVDLAASPLPLRQSPAVLVTLHDVSRRYELEQEKDALRDRFVYLERMEAVGKLAGGIAHDFNNLLHAIQGSLDYMARNDDPAARKQAVKNIDVATKRAEDLTGQLLAYARGGKYEVSRIDIGKLVRETEDLFRPMVANHHDLRVVVHPDPMFASGDRTQLQQVVLNLLLNAQEALPESQGRITVRVEPVLDHTPGWKNAQERSDSVCDFVIRVRDSGCGISPEVEKRIFEPFFTTKTGKGTGMGLAMAYGCIENHHGVLHVESQEGEGTEFFVFLPSASRTELPEILAATGD